MNKYLCRSCKTTLAHLLLIVGGFFLVPFSAFSQEHSGKWYDAHVPVFVWNKGNNMLKTLQEQKTVLYDSGIPFQYEWLSAKTNASISLIGCLTNAPIGEVLTKILTEEDLYTIFTDDTLFVFDREDYGDTDRKAVIFGRIRNKRNEPLQNISVSARFGTNRTVRIPAVVDASGKFIGYLTYSTTISYIKIANKKFALEERIDDADRVTTLIFSADGCAPFLLDVNKIGIPSNELGIVLDSIKLDAEDVSGHTDKRP